LCWNWFWHWNNTVKTIVIVIVMNFNIKGSPRVGNKSRRRDTKKFRGLYQITWFQGGGIQLLKRALCSQWKGNILNRVGINNDPMITPFDFSVNRKWTGLTTSFPKLHMYRQHATWAPEKDYFGSWQYKAKQYPVNAIWLLK
jgi:hypothetical protein